MQDTKSEKNYVLTKKRNTSYAINIWKRLLDNCLFLTYNHLRLWKFMNRCINVIHKCTIRTHELCVLIIYVLPCPYGFLINNFYSFDSSSKIPIRTIITIYCVLTRFNKLIKILCYTDTWSENGVCLIFFFFLGSHLNA